MGRVLIFFYGIVCYLIFFIVFLYSIAFVGNLRVPKSIDSGYQESLTTAIIINVVLLSLFAIQHTIMARPGFKASWTKIIPEPMERSTFVLIASLILALIYWQWQPMTQVIWNVQGSVLGTALTLVFWGGWAMVLLSTFMINHFDLFGLRQTFMHFDKREYTWIGFSTMGLYKLVRHPIMTGFIIAFWATPYMTTGHLLFAVVTTAYIFIGIRFEEKDLVAEIGEDYVTYRQKVGALFPGLMKAKK